MRDGRCLTYLDTEAITCLAHCVDSEGMHAGTTFPHQLITDRMSGGDAHIWVSTDELALHKVSTVNTPVNCSTAKGADSPQFESQQVSCARPFTGLFLGKELSELTTYPQDRRKTSIAWSRMGQLPGPPYKEDRRWSRPKAALSTTTRSISPLAGMRSAGWCAKQEPSLAATASQTRECVISLATPTSKQDNAFVKALRAHAKTPWLYDSHISFAISRWWGATGNGGA